MRVERESGKRKRTGDLFSWLSFCLTDKWGHAVMGTWALASARMQGARTKSRRFRAPGDDNFRFPATAMRLARAGFAAVSTRHGARLAGGAGLGSHAGQQNCNRQEHQKISQAKSFCKSKFNYY